MQLRWSDFFDSVYYSDESALGTRDPGMRRERPNRGVQIGKTGVGSTFGFECQAS